MQFAPVVLLPPQPAMQQQQVRVPAPLVQAAPYFQPQVMIQHQPALQPIMQPAAGLHPLMQPVLQPAPMVPMVPQPLQAEGQPGNM
jgi:hypothetical protein